MLKKKNCLLFIENYQNYLLVIKRNMYVIIYNRKREGKYI